ncbi:MAG: SLC13 family permease [Phycisphaerales bacterium]|nr:SLC13 family permease [Phycisphaerales bacterium]
MTGELAIVLGLLAAAILMFGINRPRMDAVALIMLVALPFTGVVTVGETLSGFSDPNIVLIAALFVLGEGLVRTGVARALGDWVIRRTGSSETLLVILLMAVVCLVGSFMSSTAVTAIFIPVALRISKTTGTSARGLMMPLSAAALVSGMMTLVATTPNLIVNAELLRQGEDGLGFFAFTPFGLPILAVAITYMLVARRWLRPAEPAAAATSTAPSLARWIEQYKLANREHRLQVTASSPLVGEPLSAIDLRGSAGASIIAIERPTRRGRSLIEATASTELAAGDVLLVDWPDAGEAIEALRSRLKLEAVPLAGGYFTDRTQEIGMAEVLVPADSDFIGQTVIDAKFRTRTGLNVIGLRRGAETVSSALRTTRLHVGDTLLVVGRWGDIEKIQPDHAGIVLLRLPSEARDVLPVQGRAVHAVAILALVIVLMVTGWVPNVQAALLGCLLMGAFGCIDLPGSYRAIDWKTLVLIVGMLPFSTALQRTGGVDLAADALMAATSGAGIRVVLAALFAITMCLGMFVSNTATAILMAPVAIAVAGDLGASPKPFAMIVALAASTAFVTPVSSPVNTLVVTPGNYTFGDFVRIGGPLAVIVLILSVTLVPMLLPP